MYLVHTAPQLVSSRRLQIQVAHLQQSLSELLLLLRVNMGQESKARNLVVAIITHTSVALIVVLLRLYVKFILTRTGSHEDWIVAVGMVFAILMTIAQMLEFRAGLGQHQDHINLSQAIDQLKWLWWSIYAYTNALNTTKLSILMYYQRVFNSDHRIMTGVKIVGIFVILNWITVILTNLLHCLPIHAFWEIPLKPTAKCLDTFALWKALAAINIVSDVLIAALPLRVVWGLKMTRTKRILCCLLFALGGFVCVVSVLRLQTVMVLERHMDDNSWYGSITVQWSALETNIAIICASLPAMYHLATLTCRSVGGHLSSHSQSYFRSTKSNRSTRSRDENSKAIGSLPRSAIRRVDEFSVHSESVNRLVESQKPGGETPDSRSDRSGSDSGATERSNGWVEMM
ncbi:hypothetical protein EJ05DRAFT_243993 [Pseudovirgaria hyperparasitica]|uniref:Rhodopsin domain-containing protein n=1 Tax=Pseudovirgaria hyperparasitica TaxID=470096 RepID=A0A6A6WFQ6_9PEZI|nr:uncharacterized protein EJ05DRAFT_243993 [Pseudovirgaria hyperparasitica]KAF2760850.1 hypothetical protein EJ05DRAFT_243993 [Pseudovirgaria hyperparasitica]